jgi:DNA-binding Lrp family transcriptional regulator
VWVDETRPVNQGARLTAWELGKHGVKHTVITDNAGGHLMQHGMVDLVIVGTDRTTYTGDVANKIGTYLKALAARDNNVPFYVALPSSTFDWSLRDGVKEIPIEKREADEIRYVQGWDGDSLRSVLVPPPESPAANYASFRKSLDIFFTAHLNFLMLTELEKKIIASIQEDLAVTERPFLEISKSVKVPEEVILDTLKALCTKGVIRRFGATIRHQKSGFEANAMAAWRVDEERIDSIGELMASFKEVSHCYRRNPTDEWPYNLYTMIHASDEESCKATARKMARKASLDNYTLLFSRRELKKTSMKYFPDI